MKAEWLGASDVEIELETGFLRLHFANSILLSHSNPVCSLNVLLKAAKAVGKDAPVPTTDSGFSVSTNAPVSTFVTA